jgi:hypothetical protein
MASNFYFPYRINFKKKKLMMHTKNSNVINTSFLERSQIDYFIFPKAIQNKYNLIDIINII